AFFNLGLAIRSMTDGRTPGLDRDSYSRYQLFEAAFDPGCQQRRRPVRQGGRMVDGAQLQTLPAFPRRSVGVPYVDVENEDVAVPEALACANARFRRGGGPERERFDTDGQNGFVGNARLDRVQDRVAASRIRQDQFCRQIAVEPGFAGWA